jgi:carboxypeptidase C (cathepsin A)
MGLHPEMRKQITWQFYQAGHMLYIDSDSSTKLKSDVAKFIDSALQ